MITSYSIEVKFLKKYNKNWFDDGEINVEDSKKETERTQEVIVVNGEEIVYETIENENTATLIFVISLATFVMVMFISCILAAIYRQIKYNQRINQEAKDMLNFIGTQ